MVDRILIEDGGVFDGTWQMLDDCFGISVAAGRGEPEPEILHDLCAMEGWTYRIISDDDAPFEPTNEELRLTNGDMLNPRLVKEKKLTRSQVVWLVQLHHKKDEVLRKAFTEIQDIERDMQRAWGFEVDETKFTHCWKLQAPPVVKYSLSQESITKMKQLFVKTFYDFFDLEIFITWGPTITFGVFIAFVLDLAYS